jgi:peptidoglycan hydrolase FlgJ
LTQIVPAAPGPVSAAPHAPPYLREAQLRSAAEKLEAGFLAEMLRSAGAGATPESFGGGDAAAQFSSFLLEAQAEKMVRAGGIGLAQSLFEAMQSRDHHA